MTEVRIATWNLHARAGDAAARLWLVGSRSVRDRPSSAATPDDGAVDILCAAGISERESAGVTKRLVDIDDEVLEAARSLLGTRTLKDTVNESLRRTVAAAGPAPEIDWDAFTAASVDLDDPEVMRGAWE